jgi:potassium channel subfamily K
MNDPGLHEPAQEAAQDVEKNEHQDEQAEHEEQEFLDPTYDICETCGS